MSLTKTITYLDDWDDIKKRAEERAEAAQKDADNKSVTKDFVNEKISEYEQKDKEESEAAYDEINDRITHIVAGEGEYYTKEESDGKYATIENVPNKTSQLTNDSGFVTIADVSAGFQPKGEGGGSQDLSEYAKISDVSANFQPKGDYLTEHQDISGKADADAVYTKVQADEKFLTEHQDISGKADASTVFTKDETRAEIANQIATIVADAPEDFNTLKEIADYIAGDKTKASQIENSIADISTALSDKADADSVYTKDEVYTREQADELFQPKGETQDLSEYAKIADVSANFQEKGDYLTANDVSTKANANEVYSITDADNTFLKQSDYNPQDLSEYAKIVDVSANFQEKGEYLTANDIASKADSSIVYTKDEVYTKEQADDLFQPKGETQDLSEYAKIADVSANFQEKGEYLTASDITGKANVGDSYTKAEADEKFQPVGNYLTEHQDISGKVDSSLVYTKEQADELFQPKGETQDLSEYAKIVDVSANFQEKGEYLTASDITNKADVGDSYTKDESDNKYQEKGDYLTANDVSTKAEKSDVDTLKNNVWDNTNGYFKTVKDSTKGQAMLWNETDGGGVMFTQSNGVKSFAGVNNGEGEKGITAQIYTVDTTNGNKGPRVTLTENGAFYSKDVTNVTEDFEIATKGDLTGFATTDALNAKADASVVYTKQETDNAIETQVANKIAEIVADAPEDFDTLKEVADYIASDKTKATEIETAISNINSSLGTKANANEVYTVVEADEKFLTASDITGKANTEDVYSKTDADAKFLTANDVSTKAEAEDVYTKTVADETFLKQSDYNPQDLSEYAKIVDVSANFQEKGEYLTASDIEGKANSADVYDTSTADSIFLKKDEYTPVEPQDLSDYAKTVDVSANFQPKGEYLTADDIEGLADVEHVYSREEADNTFLAKEDAPNFDEFAKIVDVSANFQEKGEYLTASDITGKANVGDSYTKAESDEKFQLKGEYLTAVDVSTKIDRSETETLIATEVAKIVSGAPEDFDTLKEVADYIASDKTNAAEIEISISSINSSINIINASLENKANSADVYSKNEADETFQPIGNYLTEHQDISGKIDSSLVYTKEQADDKFLAKEDAPVLDEYAKIVDVSANFQEKGEYLTANDVSTKAEAEDVYTKTVADNTFQIKGDYLTANDVSTKAEAEDVYTKTVADETFQIKGDYLTANDVSTKVDSSAVYTKQETDNAIETQVTNKVAEIVAGAPEQFNTLKEIADYIATDAAEAANIAVAISTLNTSVNGIEEDVEEIKQSITVADASINTLDASVRYLYINGSSSGSSGDSPVYQKEGQGGYVLNSACNANGYYAFAEGTHTSASGLYSHAEGMGNTEGNWTEAKSVASHAEGIGTYAEGRSSHSEGIETIAHGDYSHAEGGWTYADGETSHAEGYGTQTTNRGEHASGIHNKSTEDITLFSVGNGIGSDIDNRKNTFEIAIDGSIYINDLGGYDGTNVTSAKNIQSVIKTINASVNTLEESGGSIQDVIKTINASVNILEESGGSGDGGSSSIETTPKECFISDYTIGEKSDFCGQPPIFEGYDIAYDDYIVNARTLKFTLENFAELYTDFILSDSGIYESKNPKLDITSEYFSIDTTSDPVIYIKEADIDSTNLTFNVDGFITSTALTSIKTYIDDKFSALEARIAALENPGA